MTLEGKKTYIMLIAAMLTLLAKKLNVDLVGIDLTVIADEILTGLLAAAMFTKQMANSRESLLQSQVAFQKALLQQRSQNNVK